MMLNFSFFKSLPLKPTQLLGPVLLCLLTSLAIIFDKQIVNQSVYHHALIEQGQLWRLITGHLLHTNVNHYLLNIAGVTLLWTLHGHFYTTASYCKLFIFSGLFCSIGLFDFSPETTQYVGLSGVLHGIFVWGACKDILAKDKTGYLLLLGVCIKLAHEQIFGASTDIAQLISAPVAVDAHLWGAISGIAYLIVTQLRNRKSHYKNDSNKRK